MSTPELHLDTLFVRDDAGRILSTKEPHPSPGPLFALIRGKSERVWAVRADVDDTLAEKLDRLAGEESPLNIWRGPPIHSDHYLSLIHGRVRSGVAFAFPEVLTPSSEPEVLTLSSEVVQIEDEQLLNQHFRGWIPGEIAAGRAPMFGVMEDGYPISVCFSSRWSPEAAEAGLETAEGFRGRGLAPRVTAAWALTVRATGRIPLYSTDESNTSSLAVARKLNLKAYAAGWSIYDV